MPKGKRSSEIQTVTDGVGFSEFGIYVHEGYNLIRVCEDLDAESLGAALAKLRAVERDNPQHYLIDVGLRDEVGALWCEFLVDLKNRLEARPGRMVRIINANAKYRASLKVAGLTPLFQVDGNLEVACGELGLHRPALLDGSIVVPLINSLDLSLRTMSKVASKKSGMLKQGKSIGLQGDLSACIELECPMFRAVFIVSFQQATILKIVSRIFEIPMNELNGLVKSAVGEISNVTCTRAKKILNEAGYQIKLGLPQVILGKELPEAFRHENDTIILLPFSSDAGEYFVDIRYTLNAEAKAAA